MRDALDRFEVQGLDTTILILHALVSDPDFAAGQVNTRWVEEQRLRDQLAAEAAAG